MLGFRVEDLCRSEQRSGRGTGVQGAGARVLWQQQQQGRREADTLCVFMDTRAHTQTPCATSIVWQQLPHTYPFSKAAAATQKRGCRVNSVQADAGDGVAA